MNGSPPSYLTRHIVASCSCRSSLGSQATPHHWMMRALMQDVQDAKIVHATAQTGQLLPLKRGPHKGNTSPRSLAVGDGCQSPGNNPPGTRNSQVSLQVPADSTMIECEPPKRVAAPLIRSDRRSGILWRVVRGGCPAKGGPKLSREPGNSRP
jgi:hypothetical protein